MNDSSIRGAPLSYVPRHVPSRFPALNAPRRSTLPSGRKNAAGPSSTFSRHVVAASRVFPSSDQTRQIPVLPC